MGIAPSHVDDPDVAETTTTGESKTNDNKNTINGIVLPSLGEVPGDLECAICAEVRATFVFPFARIFCISSVSIRLSFVVVVSRARVKIHGKNNTKKSYYLRAYRAL